LKIKQAMAIIGISSIHLLRTFIEAAHIGQQTARLGQPGTAKPHKGAHD
jgi:uncharacterized membrane protein YqhA